MNTNNDDRQSGGSGFLAVRRVGKEYKRTIATVLFAGVVLGGNAGAADVSGKGPTTSIPFGHADWKTSPTDPVGFAGQGNNWYPGATPPTEFWEGTPTTLKVMTEPNSQYGNYMDVYFPEMKLLTLGGYKSIHDGFGVRVSGVTAHGNRLYIQSQTHLYCIGEK